ncbi:MAG: acylphosphatase [Bdellovibrionota bacterium]|nr:acylphosphatase [Bdellovibrionota bacterium]
MVTWKLIVHGQVQAVGYRQSVVNFVQSHSKPIYGYAKNLANGTVEVLATGDEESLENLVQSCYKGSIISKVTSIDVFKDQENNDYLDDFSIKY